jgi:hypothetical protein
MLERFGCTDVKGRPTPLESGGEIGPDPYQCAREKLKSKIASETESSKVNGFQRQLDSMEGKAEQLNTKERQKYMQMVGALQYVATVTRPDISYATSILARYMMSPTQFLLKCVDRVMRYLIETTDYGLIFKKSNGDKPTLVGYSDSDFAGDIIQRRSTSGTLIQCHGNTVYWRSKRQPIVTSSSTEAELVALTACALQVKWLKLLITDDLKVSAKDVTVYCDNQTTVGLAKDPIASDRTKHIEIKHRKIQDLVEKGALRVQWVSTTDQLADMFTKPLPRIQFENLRAQLGVVPLK